MDMTRPAAEVTGCCFFVVEPPPVDDADDFDDTIDDEDADDTVAFVDDDDADVAAGFAFVFTVVCGCFLAAEAATLDKRADFMLSTMLD